LSSRITKKGVMCLDHRGSARVSQLVSVLSSQRYLTPFAIRSISSWQWWQTGHSRYSLLAVLTGSFGWVIDVLFYEDGTKVVSFDKISCFFNSDKIPAALFFALIWGETSPLVVMIFVSW
jgi:hypothetical protein